MRYEQFRRRMQRYTADVDYLAGSPLGWREGTVLVWAGMRGVVTLAAAQTLPMGTPQRSTLILVAFLVAAGTLLVQGGSLSWVVRRLGLDGNESAPADELACLRSDLRDATQSFVEDPNLVRDNGEHYDPKLAAGALARFAVQEDADESLAAEPRQFEEIHLAILRANREAPLEIRSVGTYSSAALEKLMNEIDADEISTMLRNQSDE